MADTVRRFVFATIGFIILFIGLFFAFSPNVPVLVSAMLVVAGGTIGFVKAINLQRLTPQQAKAHKTKKVAVIVALALVAIVGSSWLLTTINPAWSLEPVFPIRLPSPNISTSLTSFITITVMLSMFMVVIVTGWVVNARYGEPLIIPISDDLSEDPPSNSKYIECPICGNEEFFEYETYHTMIPLNPEQKPVVLDGVYSYVCTNCKNILDSGQIPSTQQIETIYISCPKCGSKEYLETVVTRVKITGEPDSKIEKPNEGISDIVCFKCGEPFVDPDPAGSG
ncbi:MAG: hypothetical protein QXF41_03625 [Candidatus Micrarchaeaceae archaeon]